MNKSSKYWGPFTQQPNVLILMTDQQRTTQHYPAGWVEENLPNLTRLQKGGVTFVNNMCNTTACSPSRGVLFTGCYPTVNGVTQVGGPPGSGTLKVGEKAGLAPDPNLTLTTLGHILQDDALLPEGINYQVAYKGKWHLDETYASRINAAEQQANAAALGRDDLDMEKTYGFAGWTSPDFGNAMDLAKVTTAGPTSWNGTAPVKPGTTADFYTLGAGLGGNDERVTRGTSYASQNTQPGDEHTSSVENAVDFLTGYEPNEAATNPFLLIVSLLNPHDIWVFPENIDQSGFVKDDDGAYPWQKPPFTEVKLPETHRLTPSQLANKPATQNTTAWRPGFDRETAKEYVQFYAYLETLSDALLGDVLDALERNPHGLTEQTLVVRLADHGEMGMAQGGMREKEHQTYNETLLVPMIFAHPKLPRGAVCTGLCGLIDVIPTLADVTGIGAPALALKYAQQGTSLQAQVLDPERDTYPQFLFATDDSGAHIRTLIDNAHLAAKYSVYYTMTAIDGNPNGAASDFQYELYRFNYDPVAGRWDNESENLIPVSGAGFLNGGPLRKLWHRMHLDLTRKLEEKSQMPANWPALPPALCR